MSQASAGQSGNAAFSVETRRRRLRWRHSNDRQRVPALAGSFGRPPGVSTSADERPSLVMQATQQSLRQGRRLRETDRALHERGLLRIQEAARHGVAV